MPRLVASSTAMLSMPTPSLATILSCGEAAMAVAETIAQFVMIAEGLCSRTRQSQQRCARVTSPIFTNDFRLCPADARENTPLLPVK